MSEIEISIGFSHSPAEMEHIENIIIGEKWERLQNLNLCKPKKNDPNIVIIDEILESGDTGRTEFVALKTARWLFCDFWKVPKIWDKISSKVNSGEGGH